MAYTSVGITIEAGATFFLDLATPGDLSGWYGRFNLRESPNATPTYTTFSTPIYLVTGNQTMWTYSLDELTTGSIAPGDNEWFYEADIFSAAATPIVYRLQKGKAYIDRT